MKTDIARIPPPSDDKRWRIIDTTMRRYGYDSHCLIETLHSVQEAFGSLDDQAMHYISATLGVPLSQIYGVATFYHLFTLKPREAHHTCVICVGTSCHIKGGATILSAIEKTFRVKAGQTTADGTLYLQTARCLGSCGLAPVVVLNEENVEQGQSKQRYSTHSGDNSP